MLVIPNLQKDVNLAKYTTYKIGGPADYFVEVGSRTELITAIKLARNAELPFFLLGTGANILIRDKGFRGIVIHNLANDYSFYGDKLKATSGATIADLIEACVQKELSGLEHFAGIPSSVGGALRQNLHFLAPNRKDTFFIGDLLESAEIFDSQNETKKVDREYFRFGYDDSILHHNDNIVLSATFTLQKSSKEKIEKQITENLEWRIAKQPQLAEFPSCGSVFKKIEGVGAGRLIESAGLKGYKLGSVMVSAKHANYLVNLGGAKAAEVEELISYVQKTVQEKTGYLLEPEISLVGE